MLSHVTCAYRVDVDPKRHTITFLSPAPGMVPGSRSRSDAGLHLVSWCVTDGLVSMCISGPLPERMMLLGSLKWLD